ncbi:hypothetical protein [Klebsiella quasipneumoniae]|uniref:hypothetical protein n=1 Tax=Klebsiella quasipneumoniae TaxID=1463165 RepID=UPI0015CD4D30|nr:hypothetical protein [Klebsiella quasipneumoniae]
MAVDVGESVVPHPQEKVAAVATYPEKSYFPERVGRADLSGGEGLLAIVADGNDEPRDRLT